MQISETSNLIVFPLLLSYWQGSELFQSKVKIEVSQASKTAIETIERQGGSIVSAHYNRLGLRVLLKPEKFEGRPCPQRALPSNKLLPYYMDYGNRGYLSEELTDPETRDRVLGITTRKKLPRRPKGWRSTESTDGQPKESATLQVRDLVDSANCNIKVDETLIGNRDGCVS